MNRTLLLFIQSSTIDLYINVLTHCIENQNIQEVYFVVNGGASGQISDAKKKIIKIKDKFQELLKGPYKEFYQESYKCIKDSFDKIEQKTIEIPFIQPNQSIKVIKRMFPDLQHLTIDISGCNKKVATDVISSYIANGINHVCCFELDDAVYSSNWQFSKLYHDISQSRQGIDYYKYIDFSDSGVTIDSFNRMRSQGKMIKVLLAFSILLSVLVFILIKEQQTLLAQSAVILLALITGFGLLNDIFSFFDRLK